jgi:hypothetical protein
VTAASKTREITSAIAISLYDVRRRRGLTWSLWRGAGLTELPPLSSVAYARTRKPNGLLMDFGAHVNGRAAASDRGEPPFFERFIQWRGKMRSVA